MNYEKYTMDRDNIKNILGYIESEQIAIPELQRPFVWKPRQITKLIESLYNGLPTGFIVIWTNDQVGTKNVKDSAGKKVIIDGQQRITALRTALLGQEVITEEFSSKRFMVAFDPFEEKFETYKPVHDKSSRWISDISIFFQDSSLSKKLKFIEEYVAKNPKMTKERLLETIENLTNIVQREVGVVKLSSKLSISEATSIFNLMNSTGTKLGQEDYIMAKLSSDMKYEGHNIWKTIDYFCKGMHDKKYIEEIEEKDPDFASTEYYNKIKWVAKYSSNIYIPTYNDVLRVSYGIMYKEGLLKKLSGLLDGRNFEEKTIDESISKKTFDDLKEGLFSYINEHNYKNFNLFIESTGIKYKKLVNSQSSLNMAYVVYLLLKDDSNVKKIEIGSYVQKWYILSVLTGRYSASMESKVDSDLKKINERGFVDFFNELEMTELNTEFWNTTLIHDLETSYTLAPAYLIYLAAQIKNDAKSLFSSTITVDSIIKIKGDVHHVFPKGHLKENKIKDNKKINQVCNYAYINTNSNIDISDDAPKLYFNEVLSQSTPNNTFGFPKSEEEFNKNLVDNCIPSNVLTYDYKNYDTFLKKRRKLMSDYIKEYYESL